MHLLTRRKIGILLAVLAPVVFVALAWTDVRLVTMSSTYFAETGATVSRMHLHWPVAIPTIIFIAGMILALLPRRENAA